MTESGVWATCFGGFTIVYRHRSTEWPLPYTDSRTPRPRARDKRGKEPWPIERRRKRGKSAKERNTIDRERTGKRNDLPTSKAGRQTEVHLPLPFPYAGSLLL